MHDYVLPKSLRAGTIGANMFTYQNKETLNNVTIRSS